MYQGLGSTVECNIDRVALWNVTHVGYHCAIARRHAAAVECDTEWVALWDNYFLSDLDSGAWLHSPEGGDR